MQDSTKDGSGGGDRRNWRERLGVGQDLPKISDEFKPSNTESQPDQGQARDAAQSGTQLRPVRPAPMAPRLSRATPRPVDHASASKSGETRRHYPASAGSRPLGTPAEPTHKPGESFRQHRPLGQPARPGAPQPAALATARPGQSPRTSPPPTPQRPAPTTWGSDSHSQPGRPSTTPSTAGSDSFSERLRAQREAAERLAQQRLAAARDRSTHAGAETKTLLASRHAEMSSRAEPAAQPESTVEVKPAGPKPAGAEQPRFTFAQEEIVAAQRESAPHADALPPADAHEQRIAVPPPYAPPDTYARSKGPHDDEAPGPTSPAFAPPHTQPGEYRPDGDAEPALGFAARPPGYRHEDDGMFEDERPGLQAGPTRASAADYSAAYREFEDEFDDEPKRRSGGPLLVLLSLLAVAVISGGVIYWYQQLQSAPAPETADLPVIMPPEESAKADPEPLEQPQAAVQPTQRKQIYDRILGQESLEPERIVPTEEQPQLRQIQQAPGSGPNQSEGPTQQPARQDQSTEPLPLPLPPPPGTGEQGNLLIPGMANTEVASAATAPAQRALPAPVAEAASSGHSAAGPSFREASTASGETARADAGERAAGSPSDAAASSSIYPEPAVTLPYAAPTTPLPYSTPTSPPEPADVAAGGPVEDQASELDAAVVAPLPEPEPEATPEPEAAPVIALPEPEFEPDSTEVAAIPETEPDAPAEPGSAVPLPRAKPEAPAGVRTVTTTAPQTQPQRQATTPQSQPQPQRQPSGGGPVQITPTVLSPDAPAGQQPQSRPPQAQQPAPAPSPQRRSIGREHDPLEGQRPSFSGSPLSDAEPATRQPEIQQQASQPEVPPQQPSQPVVPQQQVAGVAPEQQRSQPQASGGYVVQLASFRSESEALSEYQRLVQRYPQLVGGLGSRVQQASLGQSGTFYRLGVGPLAERSAATRLCNDLIAAGEKDCLVRGI